MTPDFVFDAAAGDLPLPSFEPIYGPILAGQKPVVSVGNVTRELAESWLKKQHDRYRSALGDRSAIIQKLDILDAVALVGLKEGSP